MMKVIKRITAIITAALTLLSLAGCGKTGMGVGTGTPGVVESHDWSEYDALIQATMNESDPAVRETLFHQAEDMVMDTGAVIPLFYSNHCYLKKDGVTGEFDNPLGQTNLRHIYREGSDTLRLQVVTEPSTMDFTTTSTLDGLVLSLLVGSGLVEYDENGKLRYNEAESIDVSDDGLDYTVNLRHGMKWSDGSVHDANDYVFSWKRAAASETGAEYGNMLSYIDGYPDNLNAKASPDGNTLYVHLSAPCLYFIDLLTMPVYFPLKQDYLESCPGYRNAEGKVVGPTVWASEAGFPSNGPYIMTQWEHNQNMVFEKNPEYYAADEIKTGRLEMMLTTDATVAYAAYNSGDLDFITTLPSDEMETIKNMPDFNCNTSAGLTYIQINVKSDIFAGMTWEEACTFRKAMYYIIDRQFLIDVVLQGGQIPANTIVTPNMSSTGTGREFRSNSDDYSYPCQEETGYFPVKPDLNKAREMLKSIGFRFDEDGKLDTTVYIEYLLNSGSANENIAACLQQDFAELGIVLTIKTEDFSVFVADRSNGNCQFARGGWSSDLCDPIGMLEMFCTDNANNSFQLGR